MYSPQTSSKVPLTIMTILFLVAAAASAYFYMYPQSTLTTSTSTPTPSPLNNMATPTTTTQPAVVASPQATAPTMLKDGKSSIVISKSWQLTDNTKQIDLYQDGKPQWSQDVVVSQNNYKITSRNPLAWGPGICLFPDSPNYNDPNQMGTQYESYFEFGGGATTFRRVSTVSSQDNTRLVWTICSKTADMVDYASVAGYGTASYETPLSPSSSILAEMDNILMSMKKVD